MKSFVWPISILMLLSSVAGTRAAQPSRTPPPEWLYSLEKLAPPPLPRPLVVGQAEELAIRVDPARVAANPPVLLIDLPGHGPLEAVRTRFDAYPDWKSWFGVLRTPGRAAGEAGWIYLGAHGDRLSGDLRYRGETYRIVGGPEVGQRLVRLDPKASPPPCGVGDESVFPVLPLPLPLAATAPVPAAGTAGSGGDVRPKATTSIDVLAVYPAHNRTSSPAGFFKLTAAEETEVRTFVAGAVAWANAILANSGIDDVRYSLLGTVPLVDTANQPATLAGLSDTAAWVTGDRQGLEPRAAEVAALRDAFGADLVTVVIPAAWNQMPVCGVANLPMLGSFFRRGDGALIREALGDRAFTVVRSGCGASDFTLPHEWGHNHGLRHDDSSQSQADLFPEGRGYVFEADAAPVATLMGCICGAAPKDACSGDVFDGFCGRIPNFSNPLVTYPPGVQPGVPTGTVPTTGDAGHNEAGAFRARAGVTSAYRTRSANPAPVARFTVICGANLTCTVDAGTSSDDAAIPAGNYWWDFGDGSPLVRAIASISHPFPAAGTYRIHLVVQDAGGQTSVAWKAATPTLTPIYEGFLENATCSQISGWAWDQNRPTSPISVTIARDGVTQSTLSANQFRQDLAAAGKGNGYHAFSYTPNSGWKDGRFHTVDVRFAGTSTGLAWSPKQIFCGGTMFGGLSPEQNLSTGGTDYSVGTEFSAALPGGWITRLGFYRAAGESGQNTLHLATAAGLPLRSASTSCTAEGWCWATITPYPIVPGDRYVAWVDTHAQQAKTPCGLGSGLNVGPFTAYRGLWVAGNAFPTTNSCSNFFVDVQLDL